MFVKRIYLILITFFIMIVLSFLTNNIILSGIITFLTIIIGCIIIGHFRIKKRISLLEEDCNPQVFLEATEKQRAITGKNPKMSTYFDIDKSAGLISLGQFQEAKELLMSINKSYLHNRNGTFFAYTINLISCLYELGEIKKAEELFETQIPLLSPINKKMTLSMKSLVAERLFFLEKYEESKASFNILLKEKLTKRVRLSILYDLAQIDEKLLDINSAMEKYKEIVDNGNELGIVKQAKKRIEYLSGE